MLADLNFALATTAPIFCILVLGILFKRIGWINDEFALLGSELVFNVTLPCLLFVKLVKTDFQQALPTNLTGYALLATLVLFLILDLLLAKKVRNQLDRGVFVQGAFRSNMGIIGLAYCISAFGEGIVTTASIYLAFVTILYNVLSVITLSRHQPIDTIQARSKLLVEKILKNPLILSICAGMILSICGITIPDVLLDTGNYFAQMTLPLALLCAGASIRLHEFQASPPLYWATSGKLIFVPLLITLGGIAIGLRGENLGVLYLMSASPTAAASYPMAQAMKSNYHLAAAIIAATTLLSVFSTTLGLFLLRSFGQI